MADTQEEFAEIGLASGEVRGLLVLSGRAGIDETVGGVRIVGERDALRAIAAFGSRLTSSQVEAVLARAMVFFTPASAPAPVTATVPEPVIPSGPREVDQDALLSIEEVDAALLEGVLAQPIEEWMSFLHPRQAKLVRRSFAGPSRIRGPAGTGKTVVGLHRAAHLARTRPGRVLVTTLVQTLPVVLSELLRRFAPDVAARVDFVGVHAFARGVPQERGVTFRLDPTQSDAAFAQAWLRVGVPSGLALGRQDQRYWADEIQYVLKGRGITSFEEYAELPRQGRRHPLSGSGRRDVWALYEAYDAELRNRGVIDYADLILLAAAELRREPPSDAYAAVIVDEAQDLSCAMVRMLHSLVGDAPDWLTLIGDGQQSIYPGGYTLGEAGLSVAGRGAVLDINYRNTAQIVSFAQRLVDGDEYADIEGVVARGDVPSSVPRAGVEPVVTTFTDTRALERAMVERVRRVTCEIGTGLGDVAVLCLTRRAVDAVARALSAAGLPVLRLEEYDGVPSEAVKVGTIKRAKGLEFKQVLIPDVWRSHTMVARQMDDTERERWELTRRELYVAMTRARDGLWVALS